LTIRVLLADDHPVVREGVRAVLASEPDFEVVGEAEGGGGVSDLVDRLGPDVVLVDLMMPDRSGLEVIQELTHRFPRTRVLVLSMHEGEAYVLEALRRGASGYALKRAPPSELVRAVREVAAGRRYLSPPLTEHAVEAYARRALQGSDPYDALTEREREVLALVAEGHTNAVIAERLFISPRTVETHRAHAMKKLSLQTPADVVRYALRRGILAADE
jgi:two-component system, NarL family, response regulator NreC